MYTCVKCKESTTVCLCNYFTTSLTTLRTSCSSCIIQQNMFQINAWNSKIVTCNCHNVQNKCYEVVLLAYGATSRPVILLRWGWVNSYPISLKNGASLQRYNVLHILVYFVIKSLPPRGLFFESDVFKALMQTFTVFTINKLYYLS